jgi:hypothetical protein
MTNLLFPKGKQGLIDGSIDLDTATIKVSLVRGYTYDAAHDFVNDVTGAGGTLAATATLAGKTVTDGVFDADNVTFASVAANATACDTLIIYQASAVTGGADVAASSQRLIARINGRQLVTAAATASTSATSITVDPLTAALANASTVVFGGVTATLTASAAAGARSLTVSALSGSVSQGTAGTSSAQNGLPIVTNGGDITVAWDSTGIFRI